uniref:Uncharacterized protein n=1 Tax=Panagrolaimus sp. JU765 TaxID=591449 RepID=A0AC34Q3B2_9BILA
MCNEASANAKGYSENKNEDEEIITFDTFNHEAQWFENKFKAGLFTPNFILKFIICAPLYFEGNEQKLETCKAATALFESLKIYAENQENGQEMKKALSKFGKAIKEAAPFSRIDPDLSAIHEEEESMDMDDVPGNEEDDL